MFFGFLCGLFVCVFVFLGVCSIGCEWSCVSCGVYGDVGIRWLLLLGLFGSLCSWVSLGLYGSCSWVSLGLYGSGPMGANALGSLWVSMGLLGLYGSCSWVSLGLYALGSLWVSMAPALGSLWVSMGLLCPCGSSSILIYSYYDSYHIVHYYFLPYSPPSFLT